MSDTYIVSHMYVVSQTYLGSHLISTNHVGTSIIKKYINVPQVYAFLKNLFLFMPVSILYGHNWLEIK